MDNLYIYVYLDTRKPGKWSYKDIEFDFQPFYIGKGRKYRLNQHLNPGQLSKNTIKSNTILAIQKETGTNPLYYKIYENLSYEEANEIESDIIKFFGRRDLGTGFLANMTDGGEGFKNIIFTEETKKKMSDKAKDRDTTYDNNGSSKLVEKLDKEGNLIKSYSSLREAAEDFGTHFSNISNWCRGVCKSSDGNIWRYAGKSYKKKPKPVAISKRKKVYQYDLKGKFIQEWCSVSRATEQLNIKHISCVCLGRLQTAGNFRWSYELLEELPELVINKEKYKKASLSRSIFYSEKAKLRIGEKYNNLLIEDTIYFPDKKVNMCKCKCDCGKETHQIYADLKSGKITSCGKCKK